MPKVKKEKVKKERKVNPWHAEIRRCAKDYRARKAGMAGEGKKVEVKVRGKKMKMAESAFKFKEKGGEVMPKITIGSQKEKRAMVEGDMFNQMFQRNINMEVVTEKRKRMKEVMQESKDDPWEQPDDMSVEEMWKRENDESLDILKQIKDIIGNTTSNNEDIGEPPEYTEYEDMTDEWEREIEEESQDVSVAERMKQLGIHQDVGKVAQKEVENKVGFKVEEKPKPKPQEQLAPEPKQTKKRMPAVEEKPEKDDGKDLDFPEPIFTYTGFREVKVKDEDIENPLEREERDIEKYLAVLRNRMAKVKKMRPMTKKALQKKLLKIKELKDKNYKMGLKGAEVKLLVATINSAMFNLANPMGGKMQKSV